MAVRFILSQVYIVKNCPKFQLCLEEWSDGSLKKKTPEVHDCEAKYNTIFEGIRHADGHSQVGPALLQMRRHWWHLARCAEHFNTNFIFSI